MKRSRLIAAALVAGLLAWAAVSVAQDTARVNRAAATPLFQLGVAHPGEHYPSVNGTKPIVFLVVGDSYRIPGQASHLADAIHLIGYNPQLNRASILDFPRDLYVPIPGNGSNKINAALEFGGPQLLIQTIEDLTKIHIDYYGVTTFDGLKTITNDVGGVVVKVPYAINDSHAGANFKKGKVDMNGKQALAFTRARYGVPDGDFSRTQNQGLLLQSFVMGLHKQFAGNQSRVLDWLGTGLRNTTNDIPFDRLLPLAFAASQIPPKNVNNTVVPGGIGTQNIGGVQASIVTLLPQAKQVFADMAKDGVIGKK